eukprot:TRINITY_DN145_c0_g4_i1.p1 TRINITY_DN145_c0_g4~~TRINITY_DN145_c0_g4_i1.p1  ORF type:complete len:334 (+),score=110.24 TRINITY_DN145_c0_g4_i1:49-1050(+)
MGLRELSNQPVENMVKYHAGNYGSMEEFLAVFGHVLETFYECRGYQGDWIQELRHVHADYTEKTHACMRQDMEKTETFMEGVQQAGFSYFFTAFLQAVCPEADSEPKQAWMNARDILGSLVKDPNNKELMTLCQALHKGKEDAKGSIGGDAYMILLQALGCNYFTSRGCGMPHDAAMAQLAIACEFFERGDYVDTIAELTSGSEEDLAYLAQSLKIPELGDDSKMIGLLGTIGLLEGCSWLVNKVRKEDPNYGKMMLVLPLLTGITNVVYSQCHRAVEAKFEDALAFGNHCKKVIDEYERIYGPMNEALQHMLNFMKQPLPSEACGAPLSLSL